MKNEQKCDLDLTHDSRSDPVNGFIEDPPKHVPKARLTSKKPQWKWVPNALFDKHVIQSST
jgi:hypothetical protein